MLSEGGGFSLRAQILRVRLPYIFDFANFLAVVDELSVLRFL